MTIQDLISKLTEISKTLTDGLDSDIRIGHTYGLENIVFGDLFIRYNEKRSIDLIDSYYYYEVKYDGLTSDMFMNLKSVEDFIKEHRLKDYTVWLVENGKHELYKALENGIQTF